MVMWLVRAGQGGYLVEEFVARGFIAIGWHKIGDLSAVTSEEGIREQYNRAYPDEKPARAALAVSMIVGLVSHLRIIKPPSIIS
jgi:restriction system protein